ncbi:NUDIX hydrolase [Candidatus Roizmanbacteria bacterium]|nr:NUDIX hydrolase [Candidatus Roizmanbacteria bacterium]
MVNKSGAIDQITPSVGVLIFKGSAVLLVKHGKASEHIDNVYGLPAGRIPVSETEKVTAVRELFEETGLQTSEGYLIDFPHNIFYASIKRKGNRLELFSFKVFIGVSYRGELRATDETTPQFIATKEINKYECLPNVKEAIEAGWKFIHKND